MALFLKTIEPWEKGNKLKGKNKQTPIRKNKYALTDVWWDLKDNKMKMKILPPFQNMRCLSFSDMYVSRHLLVCRLEAQWVNLHTKKYLDTCVSEKG
jgi:hypothetical protein